MQAAHELVLLGTGAACGSPAFYCGCEACQEALENPAEAKTCSSALVLGSQATLIDTAPELRLQFARAGISGVDRVLFTHEHFDHAGGFAQLEYPIRLGLADALPVYGSKRCLEWLDSHFEWMRGIVEPHAIEPFQTLVFDEVSYTVLPAAHCPDAVGYLIEKDGWRAAYFPDTGPLAPQVLELLRGVDVLIHDSTFIGRNWNPQTHSSVDGTIALGRELGVSSVYLAHCTMHFDEPRTAASLRQEIAQMDTGGMSVVLPQDGCRIPFGS